MKSHASSLVFLHYLTTVFDAIKDSILLIGIEPGDRYRLLIANEPFYHTTGFPRDSIGKLVDDIVKPASYEALTAHYKDVIAAKKAIEYTEWSNPPSGRRAYHVQLIPILNSVGEVVQMAAAAQDVTELELRKENKRLHKKLKELTAPQKD